MKKLYIKFNEEGGIKSWSSFERPPHLILEEIPDDFKGNEDLYVIDIQEGELVGVKYREDLTTYLQYKDYLNNFDYGEMGENEPLGYEDWKSISI